MLDVIVADYAGIADYEQYTNPRNPHNQCLKTCFASDAIAFWGSYFVVL